MVITFVGHSLVSAQDKIKQEVKEQIKANMLKTEQSVFYNGGYGDFDNVCAIACKELKKECPDIEIVYISPYISPSEQEKIKELQRCGLCDATIYPPIEGVPLKFAISKRNEWMVTSADLIIAYVNHSFGGAYKSLQIAKRRKKKIINLGNLEI